VALADRHIVSLVLHHLSEMKYKDRRQGGPDQPVELLEFRPTLVPSILVNKLWADESTSILWKCYPHLPALQRMDSDRQQYYANKVERLFVLTPSPASDGGLAYLAHLDWPQLKTFELEADWTEHGRNLKRMMHASLKHLEITGTQSGDPSYINTVLLPDLFASCQTLQSIHFGPDAIDPRYPVHSQVLGDLLEDTPTIKHVRIMRSGFAGKDVLFRRLSQYPGLEALEIDLDPGVQLLPFLQGTSEVRTSFSSLRRLHVMCYPEIALAISAHLPRVEHLSMDVARIPTAPVQDSDITVLSDILTSLVRCKHLQLLKLNVGQLATAFPSAISMPSLTGDALLAVATGCPGLKDMTLLASEPAAIDASLVSSAQFQQFCQRLPGLTQLSLKLNPRTTIQLEENALRNLSRYCRHLEILRLKIASQLPNAGLVQDIPHACGYDIQSPGPLSVQPVQQLGPQEGSFVETKAGLMQHPASVQASFPHLTHLALARSQTILSITADTYAASFVSQSSSVGDPGIEEELVQVWAQSLAVHFPRLEVLEAWGDWTGHDNDSLTYFMPLEEPLASTWEFLSGVEQDLWDDGEAADLHASDHWDTVFEANMDLESRGSGDWDRASLVNEFHEELSIVDNQYLSAYDEEPEDMATPVGDQPGWLGHSDAKFPASNAYKTTIHASEDSTHHLTYSHDQTTTLPVRSVSQQG
jgi:hypothetical protein